jgi:predicted DsbA family dithiol-disulfide isomerase
MKIEIWSDIACPFCYLNKRRFDAALDGFEHREGVTVAWRSFELDPDAPAEREENDADRLAAKYGWTRQQALDKLGQLAGVAARDGLTFRYDIQRSGSSFDGHRLVRLAATRGLAGIMQERLMRAFWSEGALLADTGTLTILAGEAGVPVKEARAMLASELFAAEVRADEQAARDIGVTAVPAIAVNGKLRATGSQSVTQLRELLTTAWADGNQEAA